MSEIEEAVKQMGFDAEMAHNLAEVVRITRDAAIEECAQVADKARESAKEHYGVDASIGADIAARRIRALTVKQP